ncbi:hypothetical protein H310_07368 [Aphanomyces invadans]|uniref:Cyclic nucleotide-binding domain-containing protein n=1 Tax=Aphanomyces invadans TaxID=157072 RepID=A0A024U4N4_9STRA|nr:hypothetical protein H310_07368 [Aphanomyces invadans]ETW00842.1 hypothetical protein H310_07368 [Aphanomyces invadans]|eukprot:XP_008870977.1 hypothetical protein H310_07368 [Aphanomyces invadans]
MTLNGGTATAADTTGGSGPAIPSRPSADSMKFEKYRTKVVLAILEIPPYDRTDSDVRIVYQFLKDRELFSFLSSHALLYLAAEVFVSRAQDGDVLHYQDDEVTGDSCMHIILEGSLCGYKSDAFSQRTNRDASFPQWLATHCAESNEPLDFGECVTTFHSGAECGLTDIASKHTVHRKFSVLAQEPTTAVSIRKDTMERATAYMGAKTSSVYAVQDSADHHQEEKSVLHSFLAAFPFMTQLPQPLQLRLVDDCRQRKLRKHEALLGQGITSHDIIVVLNGRLGSFRLDRNNIATAIEAGTNSVMKHYGVELAQVTAGESYGDYHLWSEAATDARQSAEATSPPYVVSLIATETTHVVLLDRRHYRHIAATHVPDNNLEAIAAITRLDRTWRDVCDLKAWLKRKYFFQQLPDRIVRRLAESAIGAPPWPIDKVVYNKASDADYIYFVVAGAVRVQLNAADPGIDVLPGDMFGVDEVGAKRKRQRVAITKAADTILLKFPSSVYMECLVELAVDLTFAPSTGFRALECYAAPPSVADVNELAKFFRNVRVLAHLPFYVMLELVPYFRVRNLDVGDLVCAEDNATDEFVSVVAGKVACHSRDRADEAAEHLFQSHPLVHVPSMHREQVSSDANTCPAGATSMEKTFAVMYGTPVHVLEPGDTCRTGYIDATAMRRAPMTMVVTAPQTTVVAISEHDAGQVLQRLVEWSKPNRNMKDLVVQVGSLDAAGTIQFAPDEIQQVLAHLRYPVDHPDKVVMDTKCMQLQPGDVVVHAGELIKHLVVVVSGQLAVSVIQPKLNTAPHTTTNQNTNVFTKLLTSNFKSTSKTLAAVGIRDGRRFSTVLPSIAKMSKQTPFWQKPSTIVPLPSQRSSLLRLDVSPGSNISAKTVHTSSSAQLMHKDPFPTSKDDGGNVSAMPNRMRPIVTLLPGDVWGGEVVFTRNWPSLHDVVAESVVEVMLCPRETFVNLRREAVAARSKKSDSHSKRILAKAHWKRANNKVVETILSSTNSAEEKPKFWRLLDQAASQRIKLIIKHLSHMELFQSMEDATISAIVASARYDTVEKGETIFKAGDAPKRYYVVVAGAIGLYSPHAQLEDVCLNVIKCSGGFGEFEILTEQLTRSLSAIAEDSSKLISFASQSFHDLWDTTKLDAMRHEIKFFQQLHWANRLDMDKLAHIYHTAQAVGYQKGADVVRLHAHMNTCFVIKEGTCYLGNVLPVQAKNGTTDQVDVMQVSTPLAQVSKGHSIWVLGVATFSMSAATANTIVYHISYDFLKAIMPKHHLGRLERQVKQRDQYHADQSARLRQLALNVLNTRTHVAMSAGEPEMFLPPIDLTKHDVTMTDVVAATALSLAEVQAARKKIDQVQSPEYTNTNDPNDNNKLADERSVPSKLMGSFWKSRNPGPNYHRRQSTIQPDTSSSTNAPRRQTPAAKPFFPTEVPDVDEATLEQAATEAYYMERYDVNSPFRTLRLDTVDKVEAAMNGPRIDIEAYQVLQYVIDATPNEEVANDQGRPRHPQAANHHITARTAATTIDLATGLRPWKPPPPATKNRLRPVKTSDGRQPRLPPASATATKVGKLAVRVFTNQGAIAMVHMVAELRGTTLRLSRGERSDSSHVGDVQAFEWKLKLGMRVVQWPDNAATPWEFKLDVGGNNQPRDMVTFMALSLADKAQWVALLTKAVTSSMPDKSSSSIFTLNPSRIMPVKKPDVVRRVQTVTEEILPAVTYVVEGLEH